VGAGEFHLVGLSALNREPLQVSSSSRLLPLRIMALTETLLGNPLVAD